MSYEVVTWYTLIKHLRDYARLQPDLAGIEVRAGAKKPKDPYPCMEILWNDEAGISIYGTHKGELNVWIDLWVMSDDLDPMIAYETLSTLQNKVCQVLVRWSDALVDELGVAVNLTLVKAVSDGDVNRPLANSRMFIKINWRK